MIMGYSKLNYERRLKLTGLTTLIKRRERGDLIQTYRILHGFDKVDHNIFFDLDNNSKVRGHPYKLKKIFVELI